MTFMVRLRLVLVCGLILLAPASVAKSKPEEANLEILSDTRGVDFGPYLSKVVKTVRKNWYHRIPDIARAPRLATGKATIQFAILPNGKVAGMQLVRSTGEDALDRAVWGSITASTPFEPLPKKFTGPYIALRFTYYYNP
jgi:TonB family protein